MKIHSILKYIFGLLLSLTLIIGSTAQAADTIKIGIAGSHSGDLASYGIPTVRAAQLVVKNINAKGGVMGKRVELVIEDDACKPELAQTSLRNWSPPK